MIDALHRVEEFWDEPNEFRPERFNRENSKNRDPYSYIPFSVGQYQANKYSNPLQVPVTLDNENKDMIGNKPCFSPSKQSIKLNFF